MPITIEHDDLSPEEREKLVGIIGCTHESLEATLSTFCSAAFQEYVRMFLGQKVFTRGSDIREYRLFLLIKHAFGGQLPDEQKVCDLFQTTVSQSRSLIRSVMSKYQYELSNAIGTTLRVTLERAIQPVPGGDYEFTVNSENIVSAMNHKLATLAIVDGPFIQVSKKKGTVSTYLLKPASYERLIRHYQVAHE